MYGEHMAAWEYRDARLKVVRVTVLNPGQGCCLVPAMYLS